MNINVNETWKIANKNSDSGMGVGRGANNPTL
jgi:hypothetical protein